MKFAYNLLLLIFCFTGVHAQEQSGVSAITPAITEQYAIGENIFITRAASNSVDVIFAAKQKAQVMLLNARGELYFETVKFSNRDKISIDTSGCSPGIYFLQIDQGKKKYSQKLKIS